MTNFDEDFQLTTLNNEEQINEEDVPDEKSVKTSSMKYSSLNARITKKRIDNLTNFKLDVGDELSSNNLS